MAERDAEARTSEPGGAPESPGDSTSAGEQTDLLAQLETAQAESEEYKKLLQRVQADFVNYKRRVDAERETRAEAVRAETILAFLPLVDDFQRALAHLPSEVSKEGWAQGFTLIDRNLAAAFERLGLRRVGAVGEEFDPNVHEAVVYEEHPTQAEGHVASVVRPGYQLGERVIRPAQVSVARASARDQAQGRTWPKHQAHHAAANGGVDQGDLQKPRNIERA
jgi:molecular chaperone GrpE